MKLKFTILKIVALLCAFPGFGQTETARVMTYNLMYYRQTFNDCNGTTNDPTKKDAALKKIVKYAEPDILVCNEIGENYTHPSKILGNALNTDGTDYWEQCDYSHNGFSNLVNMLFFNSEKFTLYKQDHITKDVSGGNLTRAIDFYTLYYNDPNLDTNPDTTFLLFVVAHLKAGNSSSDESRRADETEAAMKYLEDHDLDGNVFFAGDFNTYSSNEDAYQNIVNYPNPGYSLIDPVGQPGNWNNNSSFAAYHTQSTHSSFGDCFSAGGMDDRFDLILISDEVKNNTLGVEYVNSSYWTIGQDGNRFNGSVISPQNHWVPAGIDTALYELSDHLPVALDIRIEKLPVGVEARNYSEQITVKNPMTTDLNIYFKDVTPGTYTVKIVDLMGRALIQEEFNLASATSKKIGVGSLDRGIYCVEIIGAGASQKTVKKVLKL